MADDRIVGFSPDAAERLVDVTQYVESQPRYQRGRRGRREPRGKQVVTVHVTSTTPVNGLYPCFLTTWNATTQLWTDNTAQSVWAITPDGSIPQTSRYPAYQLDTDPTSGLPVYETMQWASTPPTGTVQVVSDVSCSGGALSVSKITIRAMELQILSQNSY